MKIESIRLKNFKTFRDVTIENIPGFCVLVGANGVGKSSFFSLFDFLKTAFTSNITVAFNRLGGGRGFDEVRSRGTSEPIEIVIQFREATKKPLITYELILSSENGRGIIEKEVLKYRRGSSGKPWEFLNFSRGSGRAVTNELEGVANDSELTREEQTLKSPDILAIKGLSQFSRFPAVVALGNLIENWHISDIKIDQARPEHEQNYAEHLSPTGENLSLVIQYLAHHQPEVFQRILDEVKRRVPGISHIEAKTTEEGKVLLKFQDGAFEDPFYSKYVSDGTIKMLAYLVLLHDPVTFPLLCVEEPENQLYLSLLEPLAEQFRQYAHRGGQVFVSTHSPDFLNAVNVEEVFLLEKKKGYTDIIPLSQMEQVKAYCEEGDKLGYLWKQGLFGNLNL